ncbi:MAG: ABC transporter substrate-binding protein [Clostridia bacterium]|nr:ABC transporter substrate-binding protein [Clostridia bacterium]
MSMILVIVLIIIGVIRVKNAHQNTENTKLIKVNEVTRSVFYAPQYVAINKGYFKESGLDIELTTGQGADAVMTAVLANQCDIGFAGPEASIYVYNEGKEDFCQVFAQLTKKDGSFLVARDKTENFSWQDLKGKLVIPGRKGGVPYMTLEYVLKKNGIDPQKDTTLDDSIKFDLMAGAFASGNSDYVTLFEPTASMTEKQQKGYIVASVGEAAGEIPYTAYFAKKSYMEANQETIQKFTNAIYKGQKWVHEHSSREIAEAIQSFFPDTSIELLSAAIESYQAIDAWNDTPVLKEEAFNRLQEVMTAAGELPQKAPYDKIVNNKYAEQAKN